MNVSDSMRETLEKQNAALKAELARLQQLASTLDDKYEEEFKTVTKQHYADVHDIKDAFDHFDRDESGFIDQDELLALSASLGELLDDEELKVAMQEIDLNEDGKISFNEFFKWWTADDRVRTTKTGARLQVLRAKLIGRYVAKTVPKLLRVLSEHKIQDENDWVNHQLHFSVDAPQNPAAYIRAELKFEKPDPAAFAKFENCGFLVIWDLVPKAGQAAEIRQQSKEAIEQLFARRTENKDWPHDVNIVDDKCTRVFMGCRVPDPLAIASQYNLDLTNFVRKASLALDFAHPLSALLVDDPELTLASFCKFRLQLDVSFRKAFIYALMKSGIRGTNGLFPLAWIEKVQLAFKFGDLEELLKMAKTPEGVDYLAEYARMQQAQLQSIRDMMDPAHENEAMARAIAEAQRKQLQDLQRLRQGPKWLTPSFYLQKGFQADMRALYSDLWTSILSSFGRSNFTLEFIQLLRTYFDELKSVQLLTPSGMHIYVNLQNMTPFALLPEVVKGDGGKLELKK